MLPTILIARTKAVSYIGRLAGRLGPQAADVARRRVVLLRPPLGPGPTPFPLIKVAPWLVADTTLTQVHTRPLKMLARRLGPVDNAVRLLRKVLAAAARQHAVIPYTGLSLTLTLSKGQQVSRRLFRLTDLLGTASPQVRPRPQTLPTQVEMNT